MRKRHYPRPFTVTCRECRTDRRINVDICELIIHPDERTYLAWSCPDCGPQSHPISTHQGVAWLNKLGVPIADWSHITPEDPGWPLWTVDEIEQALKICPHGRPAAPWTKNYAGCSRRPGHDRD